MGANEKQLTRIQDKLQAFVKQFAALQKENRQLREQLTVAEADAAVHRQTVETLRQQVTILKMNAGDLSETDRKEFEKKINGYLKEIDRCIALLSA